MNEFLAATLLLLAAQTAAPAVADPRPAHAPAVTGEASCWPGAPGTDPRLCPPDDPKYAGRWEFGSDIPDQVDQSKMHPAERALGSIGFSVDRAWQQTTGRDDVIIAVLDSGIRWEYPDLVRKLYLNAGELPPPEGSEAHDANGDGRFDIDDYSEDPRVGDRNGNGLLDPGDLLLVFSDCEDDDGNGYPDDISGYDFFGGTHCGFAGGDNDAYDDTHFDHGTGIASTAAAETNNGIFDVGVCPRCRVLPVRVGDSFVVDANQFARGVVFSAHSGAKVIASALGSYNNTPAARFAVDFAYDNGVVLIASAADEYSYHHNYPSVYNHALYVNSIRYNHASDYSKASTFWGVNPCTNFGARVWITVPATSCSSGATSRLAGVAGLVASAARDAGLDELHPEEIYQLLRATADDLDNGEPDWGSLRYPAKPGFDQLYGYGRVNALRAVSAALERRIPPIVDLHDPKWFAVVSPLLEPVVTVSGSIRVPRSRRATYRLEYALGVEPRESEYRIVAKGTVQGERGGQLGVLDFRRLPVPAGPPPANREERDRYSVTLRLRVTDDGGLTSEARRSFFVFHDPLWKKHFPVDVGASGEASPLLVDLDRDGRDEIVLPTADGYLQIFDWTDSGLGLLRLSLDRAPEVDPLGQAPPTRETVIRGAAIGDLHGAGERALVVASRSGKVYAFNSRGERLGGFPVAMPRELSRATTPSRRLETGALSRPVLVDLDGRPGQEIVVSGLDGHVHVWRGDGKPLAGFPVEVTSPLQDDDHRAKIVSTPAVGDIDGDGRQEIVVGSNGLRQDLAAAYAIRAEGNRHENGPFVAGWRPFEVSGVRPELLPTLAHGLQMEPLLVDADGDGDQEVILYAVTGGTAVLVDHVEGDGPEVRARYSMEPGRASGFHGTTFVAGTGSALLADLDGDGGPELFAPLISFRLLTLRSKPGIPLDMPLALGGWEVTGQPDEDRFVPMLADFPRRMEDLMILARPAAADVDGDGTDEVLMGSGGYLLHAFKKGGAEALSYPRFTGGWIFSTPAVGDLDGDGRADLVTVTREGYLFAWELGSSLPPAR
jgi:hypothetical protein